MAMHIAALTAKLLYYAKQLQVSPKLTLACELSATAEATITSYYPETEFSTDLTTVAPHSADVIIANLTQFTALRAHEMLLAFDAALAEQGVLLYAVYDRAYASRNDLIDEIDAAKISEKMRLWHYRFFKEYLNTNSTDSAYCHVFLVTRQKIEPYLQHLLKIDDLEL